jgi:hypothetical protein
MAGGTSMFKSFGNWLSSVLFVLILGAGMPLHAMTMDGQCAASCPARVAACGHCGAIGGGDDEMEAQQDCASHCAMAAVAVDLRPEMVADASPIEQLALIDGIANLSWLDPAPPRPIHRA